MRSMPAVRGWLRPKHFSCRHARVCNLRMWAADGRARRVITSVPRTGTLLGSSMPSAHFFFQLRLQSRHDGPPLHERWPLENRTVYLDVILGHASGREALLEPLPKCPAIER